MIIIVGGHQYSARAKATYLAKNCLADISRRYFWKYAPAGYYNPDGSLALVDSADPEDVVFDDVKELHVPRKVPRKLDEAERGQMYARMNNDPEYQAETLDFHLIPVGNAPLISNLLESYDPTPEEQEAIESATYFFYESGKEKKEKKHESSSDTAASPREQEASMPKNS
jgi:hypothetical protein